MVNPRTVLLLAGLTVAWAPAARANPIAAEVLRTAQVPTTHHVQITFAVDGATPEQPSALTRDGSSLTLSWHLASDPYSANTGSGLVSTTAIQACDCDVPPGEHQYVATVKGSWGAETVDLHSGVTVVENLQATPDAGVPGPDTMPWDIPEPTAIQGLDCVAVCTGTGPDGAVAELDAGATARDMNTADTGSSPTPDTGGNPLPDRDDGGCSLAAGARPTAAIPAGALLLLALCFLARRRRC